MKPLVRKRAETIHVRRDGYTFSTFLNSSMKKRNTNEPAPRIVKLTHPACLCKVDAVYLHYAKAYVTLEAS